jgi:limonene-1,2-epoxide hydrolase
MTPKQVLELWLIAFNKADIEAIINLYTDDAVNHQVANEMLVGKQAIKDMFIFEFANAEMVCIVENIFEAGEWVILEWKDPKGLRGCGFFHVFNSRITYQRGYWDKLSFYKLHNIPLNL